MNLCAVDAQPSVQSYCSQVGLEISGRRWVFGFAGGPSHFQGNTFSPQPFVSPAELRRNFLATMSYARFGCMGRSTLMPTERATKSAICKPVKFDALGIITSSSGNRLFNAFAPSQMRRKASS